MPKLQVEQRLPVPASAAFRSKFSAPCANTVQGYLSAWPSIECLPHSPHPNPPLAWHNVVVVVKRNTRSGARTQPGAAPPSLHPPITPSAQQARSISLWPRAY